MIFLKLVLKLPQKAKDCSKVATALLDVINEPECLGIIIQCFMTVLKAHFKLIADFIPFQILFRCYMACRYSSLVGTGLNEAKAISGIAHSLGVLLVNSDCFAFCFWQNI